MFGHLNIGPNEQDTSDGKVVTGKISCDSPPSDMVMLSLPSESDRANRSSDSTISSQPGHFSVSSKDLVGPNDKVSSDCVYGLIGLDVKEQPGLWVIGQSKSLQS